MKKLFCIMALAVNISSYSEDGMQYHLNSYRAGDHIIKQQMESTNPGDDGVDVLWDFSGLETVNENYPLILYKEQEKNTTQIIGWEHETRYIYEQKNDSIYLTGYSNRSVEMSFNLPELQMKFPLYYGDTLSSVFSGKGHYFQDLGIVASGKTDIKVDASGTLITPGQDTLFHVLRVKRIRNYENIGVEGSRMRLETYQWYAPGYRYPVFETVKSLIIRDNITTEDYSTAFYFPIAGLEALMKDPENETIRENNKLDRGILLSCHASPNPVEDQCTLFFELSTSATVNIKLCDIMGNQISLVESQRHLSAGQQEEKISMAGLRKGYYVLHIRANNYTNSLIIMKK